MSKHLNNIPLQLSDAYIHSLEQFGVWLTGSGTDLYGYARSDVQQYIDYLTSKKRSAATINRIFHAINKFSRWSKKEAAIEDIRVVKYKTIWRKPRPSLDRNKRNELIRTIERTKNRRNFAIITTMLYTGIRVSECAALDRSDLEMSDRKGCITIRNGKGNKERTIPLHPEVRRAISNYLDTRNDDLPALFLSTRNKRISIRSIQNIYEKQGINSHQCRHTFITALLRDGKDLGLIQSLTGHSSIDMLVRYGKPSDEEKQNAVDTLFLNT